MKTFSRFIKPLVCSVGFFAAALLAGCGGGDQGRDPILGLPASALVAVAVTPATASIAAGASQQFVATASYADGSTRDVTTASAWTSATPAVASVSAAGGLAKGLVSGSAAISAAFSGKTGSAALTVTGVTLMSLALNPQDPVLQVGATRQLAATATYSDGSSADVTRLATFSSATSAVASVSTGALTTGLTSGASMITAAFGGKTATTNVTVSTVVMSSISVTPATASVSVGATQQFVATALYSDNSSAIITGSAVWSSGTTANATIIPSGMARGVAEGSSTITATSGALSGTATLTVTAVATVPPVVVVPTPDPIPPATPLPTSLNLRSAASFAVLAGTSITNNAGGTTLVTGDVGGASQTTDPTQAAGFTNYKSGAILAGALNDLQTAITDANARTCTVSSASSVDLGGQTIGPGVYCYSGAISITGTLTLNGPGVYIFRTALTLNSTANSIVALNNGATAGDVNWLPVGPTTLGANSVFKGNILGQSAAITVGDNTTLLNGRVLTAAAITLRNNQITK